jgi:hypothetical protein
MKTRISKKQNLRRHSVGCFFQKCFSKLQHDLSMFFFADQIGYNQFKKLIHQFSCRIPLILNSPFRIMFNSTLLKKISSKFGVNPVHKFLISVYNLKSGEVINGIRSLSRLNVNRSFTINNSSQIRNLFTSPHVESFLSKLYHKEGLLATLNDLARKLLREMQKSELVTKALEGSPKRDPRLLNKQVTKVTERTNDAWVINLRTTLAS